MMWACAGSMRAHLHRDAEALVEGAQAAALDSGGDAVYEALELAVLASLAQIGTQARPSKVQRIHYQQRSGTGRTACESRPVSITDDEDIVDGQTPTHVQLASNEA